MEVSSDAFPPDDTVARAIKDITFGSIAGMVSKVFEHPFDLTKVRLQSQVLDSTARFDGPVDCLKQTFRNEGISGLYRGLPAPIVGAMAENASLFLSYGECQNLIRRIIAQPPTEDLSLGQLALAGSGSGAVTSFLLTPIELIKCKMQVQMLATSNTIIAPSSSSAAAVRLPGPISILMTVIRTEGIRGLWVGHLGTFIRELGGNAAWFTSKEFVASLLVSHRSLKTGQTLTKKDILPWESALSGACAGAAYNCSFFPADSVKSTMQTEQELRPRLVGAPQSTFLSTAKEMWKAKGFRGFYAGMGVTAVRSIPSSAIIFLIYDGLSQRFS